MLLLGTGSIGLLTGLAPSAPTRPATASVTTIPLDLPVPAAVLAKTDPELLNRRIPFEPRVPEATPASPAAIASPEAASTEAPQVVPAAADEEIAGDPAAEDVLERRVIEVARGDSLFTIFKAMGLEPQVMYRVLAAGDDAERLERLRPGQVFEFELDADGSLARLIYRPSALESVHVEAREGGFAAHALRETLERRPRQAGGVIEDSLFLSGQRVGLTDAVLMQMVEIFGWDVDFALDIRTGDRFSVIYEGLYKDGELVRNGPILAAEFENQGRVLRAVRYTDPGGDSRYYTPDGQSMRKAFLRTPVNFSRISSRFSLGRKHPVLHRVRAHKGVDYAAPTGTPVKAAGDGKVSYVGTKGGYGKTVVLQHGGSYTTLYAHLSRYARGIRAGQRVSQGQTIGYVGSTGLATGPHLHYEFRVQGTHRNPLTVPLPKAQPINPEYLTDFRQHAERLVAQLQLASRTQLAANEH